MYINHTVSFPPALSAKLSSLRLSLTNLEDLVTKEKNVDELKNAFHACQTTLTSLSQEASKVNGLSRETINLFFNEYHSRLQAAKKQMLERSYQAGSSPEGSRLEGTVRQNTTVFSEVVRENITVFSQVKESPLRCFFRRVQDLISANGDKAALSAKAFSAKEAFLAMPEAGQKLFTSEFFEKFFQAEDQEAFLRKTQPHLFREIANLPPSVRKGVEKALLENLLKVSLTLTQQDKEDWMFSHLERDSAHLENVMESFLLKLLHGMKSEDKEKVYSLLRQIAIDDRVVIKNWDQEWGKFHLTHNAPNSRWTQRLMLGLSQLDQEQRQQALDKIRESLSGLIPPSDVVRLLQHHPVMRELRDGSLDQLELEKKNDVVARGSALRKFKEEKEAISAKYPGIARIFTDSSHPLFKLWKQQELFLLTCRDPEQIQLFHDKLCERLAIFLNEPHTQAEAEMLLEMILKQTSTKPSSQPIRDAAFLKTLEETAKLHAMRGDTPSSPGGGYKEIYLIHSPEEPTGIAGKFKPNLPGIARKEKETYDLDTLFSFDLSCPTSSRKISLRDGLMQVKKIFLQADACRLMAETLKKSGEIELAHLKVREEETLRESAFKLCGRCPPEVLEGLYASLEAHLTTEEGISHDMWWNIGPHRVPDQYRAIAISNYLTSPRYHAFVNHHPFEADYDYGSIQKWIQEPGKRAYDLIVEDPTAGEKFKAMPKTPVHLYCLLGLIKGSKDCSSGNSMVIMGPDSEYVKFIDFDDEKSLPTNNHYKQFRMWQLGLPQADQPFDRTVLFMFSDPEILLNQYKDYRKRRSSELLSPGSYKALDQRMERIAELFNKELKKTTPTLTPRELFFEVCGGREEFEDWHHTKGLNPMHVFEYCMGTIGAGSYYIIDSDRTILDKNFESLYDSLSIEPKTILARVRSTNPDTHIVVKCKLEPGQTLFIRGNDLGLSWYQGQPLLRKAEIADDLWIWEKPGSSLKNGMEYKILINDDENLWELGSDHIIHSEDPELIYPQFPSS